MTPADASQLFETLCSIDSLRDEFAASIRPSSAVGRDGRHPRGLGNTEAERTVQSAYELLHSKSYVFRGYRQMLRLKGPSSLPRQIAVPSIRDRLILKMLSQYITELAGLPKPPLARDLVRSIRVAIQNENLRDFVKTDIVDFYPSIPHDLVLQLLESANAPSTAIALVESAITAPIVADGTRAGTVRREAGVPAGTSLANTLGELVLRSMDLAWAAASDAAYFRYVDDVLILCRTGQRVATRSRIAEAINSLGLRSHKPGASGKSSGGRVSSGFAYLGYTFSTKGVTVAASRTSKLTASLARPITGYRRALADGQSHTNLEAVATRAEWWMNLSITGCVAGGKQRGWLAYYSQIDDIARLRQLDDLAAELISRLPIDRRFKPKSFVRTYAMLRNPMRSIPGYIPNFDQMSDAEKRETLLVANRQTVAEHDPEKLDSIFARFVGMAVSSLEVDVGSIS